MSMNTEELTTTTTELAPPQPRPAALQSFDLNNGNLPDLSAATELTIDLVSEYWSPEMPGEFKRVFFVKIDVSPVRDVNDPDVEHLLACAYFLERTEKGEIKQLRNGSKRLVGALQTAVDQGFVKQGTPLLVTFMGKKQNRTNSFKSDNWSLKPLKLNID